MSYNNQLKDLRDYFKDSIVSTNYSKNKYKDSFKIDVKINGNSFNMFVLIPYNFPYEKPSIFIHPLINCCLVNKEGEININDINAWNYKSNIVQTILNCLSALDLNYSNNAISTNYTNYTNIKSYNQEKLPSNYNHSSNYSNNYNNTNIIKHDLNNSNDNNTDFNNYSNNNIFQLNNKPNTSNSINSNKFNDIKNNVNNEEISKMQLLINELSNEENLKATLNTELSTKSIEELILIYYNQDEYINKLTSNLKKENTEIVESIISTKSN